MRLLCREARICLLTDVSSPLHIVALLTQLTCPNPAQAPARQPAMGMGMPAERDLLLSPEGVLHQAAANLKVSAVSNGPLTV